MAGADNIHSWLVAWMKILLPLMALGILSTLFLFSDGFDPADTNPITEIDLQKRAQDQGASNATFAGVTRDGDHVKVHAENARPAPDDARRVLAEGVSAELQLTSGAVIDITSDKADMHQSKNSATLEGNVELSTTTGYVLTSERLDARFDDTYVESPGPVQGNGPPGDLAAGRMLITTDQETGDAHLLFTKGVKLVYQPPTSED